MEKTTNTNTKNLKHDKASAIVTAVLTNLETREGFKMIFPEIPKDVNKELRATLVSLVEVLL